MQDTANLAADQFSELSGPLPPDCNLKAGFFPQSLLMLAVRVFGYRPRYQLGLPTARE